MLHAVEKSTGILSWMVLHFPPKSQDFSIATKMSYASKRKTTRSEGMAYCLMGIFDVNMPLLYGEGGTKAFRRLQEEIIKQTDDHTTFYWRSRDTDRSTFRGLLARSPGEFSDSYNGHLAPTKSVYTPGRGNRATYKPGTDKTYGITNRGLCINLDILSSGHTWSTKVIRGDDEVLAILECGARPDFERKCYIILARLSDDGHSARVDAHKLPDFIHVFSSLDSSPVPVAVFVHQEPVVSPNYRSSRMTAVCLEDGSNIISTSPEETWNAHRGQIQLKDGLDCPYLGPGKRLYGLAELSWSRQLVKKYYANNIRLTTAMVRIDWSPHGEIDLSISLLWNGKRGMKGGPHGIDVQFDQVCWTGNSAGSQQHDAWKVSTKAVIRTISPSETLQIRVCERAFLVDDRLVLRVDFSRRHNIGMGLSPGSSLMDPGSG